MPTVPEASALAWAALATLLSCHAAHAMGPELVFDAADGRIVHAADIDTPWYPASLTKLMTAYVVFDALHTGRIKLDTPVVISAKAHAQPKTRVGLATGRKITVEQALQGLIIRSANDFAVALAETISGSEEAFVTEMNAAALNLDMVHTQFVNTNGLPAGGQATTARDMGLLARALITRFPEHQRFFAMEEAEILRVHIHNHNTLLKTFDGADGMKTGFTCGAGYNIVASATRNKRRLVAVVLGDQSNNERSSHAAQLLENGFSGIGSVQRPGERLDPQPVPGETLIDAPAFVAAQDVSVWMKIRKCYGPAPAKPAETVQKVNRS